MHVSPRGRLVRRIVLAVVAVALVVGGGLALHHATAPVRPVACSATVNGTTVELSPEQMANAATIAGVAVRRRLPARAATIGIATAMQESKLVNITYGDRDSLGLFQQRPSQGWGTRAQVQDPVYATNAFYDVLVKIEGYRSLTITDVAQKVQRSAFPGAYAQHEPQARVLASALTGYSPGALTCALDPHRAPAGAAGLPALQHALGREQVDLTSARLDGRPGLRIAPSAASTRAVWSLGQWAVGQADRLGVARVYVEGRVWRRAERDQGWTAAGGAGVPAPGSGRVVVLLSDVPPA